MITKDKKLTGRQKRIQHFKQMHAKAGLNLVSLMDIFTILVFFLLVNSNGQQLPSPKQVKLPTSVSTKIPKDDLILTVTKSIIVVDGHEAATVGDVIQNTGKVIPGLVKELKFQASKISLFKKNANMQHSITIMGDESIPYKVLSKILASCRAANYTHIAFAAYQKSRKKSKA